VAVRGFHFLDLLSLHVSKTVGSVHRPAEAGAEELHRQDFTQNGPGSPAVHFRVVAEARTGGLRGSGQV